MLFQNKHNKNLTNYKDGNEGLKKQKLDLVKL